MASSESYIAADDGVRLFFQKAGSGPNVVVVPNAVHMFDSFKHLTENRTLVFFDLRNRGRSDSVTDGSKLIRGILHDVDDLEAVRRHCGIEQFDLIGHSYLGLTVILYAMKYPAHVGRLVQIGPMQPHARTQYPAHLTGADATLAEFPGKLAQLQQQGSSGDPREVAGRFWALLRTLMVAEPADAERIDWTPFDYPNELKFMGHWTHNLLPSIQQLDLTPDELSKVTAPVLVIHGRRDRQAPYGGGREWALRLPNARLITIENAAHVPWIEAPDKVFGSIETFFGGAWPEAAEKVVWLDPRSTAAE
jgi:proline iminopeptidase